MAPPKLAVAHAYPIEQLSTRRLDGGESFGAALPGKQRSDGSGRQIFDCLGNQARRNGGLLDADARTGQHVAGAVVRNIESNGAIAAVRMVVADIQLQSAGAGGRTPGPVHVPSRASTCRWTRSGSVPGRFQDHPRQFGEVACRFGDDGAQRARILPGGSRFMPPGRAAAPAARSEKRAEACSNDSLRRAV